MASVVQNCQVNNLSVVLLAQSHNPSIINPDFLKNNGIVEKDWTPISPPLITPVVTQIKYEKISWMVNPEQCVVSEQINADFRDSYYLHECAKKYVEVLAHIPYRAIGLNWLILLTLRENANDWIKSRFLKSGKWQNEILSADLTLKFQFEDHSICSLTVGVPTNNTVSINCNFHFDIESDEKKIEKITAILNKWKNYQEIFRGYLDKYFIQEEGA